MKIKITAGCLLINEEKLLLVLEQQDDKISWDIPAGGIDAHETPLLAAVREVREETGFVIPKKELTDLRIYWYEENSVQTIHFLYSYIFSSLPKPASNTDKEIMKIKWFSKIQINELLATNQFEHQLAAKRLSDYLEFDSINLITNAKYTIVKS